MTAYDGLRLASLQIGLVAVRFQSLAFTHQMIERDGMSRKRPSPFGRSPP